MSFYGTARKTKREMVKAAQREHGAIGCANKIANNTLGYMDGMGNYFVRLHNTDVVAEMVNPDGTIYTVIDTGGYNTVTTRQRINAFSKTRAHTEKGTLYINNVPVKRRCVVRADGTVESDIKPDEMTENRRKVDAYMAKWKRKGLPTVHEAGGDPWCGGDNVDAETMLDWIKTGYVFRSMFVWANEAAGMPPMGIEYWMRDIDRAGGKLSGYHLQRIRRYVRKTAGI